MNRDRARLARRMADIAAFREERDRQALASARRESAAAEQGVCLVSQRLQSLYLLRSQAIATQGDVDAWLRYAALEDLADSDHAAAKAFASRMEEASSTAMVTWAAAKASLDASEDRAIQLEGDHRSHVESRDAADGIDRWLAYGRKA